MEFNCPGSELSQGIGIAEKAISNRSLPIMENIRLTKEGDNLKLIGSDLEVSIQYNMKVSDTTTSGDVLIKAGTFSSIMSKLSQENVHLSVDAQNKVIIKSDQVDFDILGLESTDYPEFPNIDKGNTFSLSASALQDLIKHTIFSVSFDETKQFLNGILMSTEGDTLSFVATDGFRLALKQQRIQPLEQDIQVIIPFKALNELSKVLGKSQADDQVQITISDQKVAFIVEDVILVSRLLQGQFPDYRQVLPQATENKFVVPRKAFLSACDRASIIASHVNHLIRVEFTENQLQLSARAPKLGDFKEDVPVSRTMGDSVMKISFNVKLILDAIKLMESDEIMIEFNNELSPCCLRPSSDSDYTYIVMPIRTSDFDSDT